VQSKEGRAEQTVVEVVEGVFVGEVGVVVVLGVEMRVVESLESAQAPEYKWAD